MTWLCEESGGQHVLVPADLVADAETKAKAMLDSDGEDDDDDDEDME